MPDLPIPILDHAAINLRDDLDRGEAVYRRLGFTLTPRGYHTLGSMNHLAVFGTDYLELIGAPATSTGRLEILASPAGLNGLVFGTDDSSSVYATLQAAGLPVGPPVQFARPVTLHGGTRDAIFRTVRLLPGAVAGGRLYFCHHFTRELVWRDEWRHHPNGVLGIARAVIAARDPSVLATLFGRMFGPEMVVGGADGCSLLLGLARFDVTTAAALRAAYGAAAPEDDGRTEFMALLSLRTCALDRAEAALIAGGIAMRREPNRIVVPASEACGVTLEFVGP